MISKEKEKATLERIMDLIEDIGGDESYVGKAFEGCYQIAMSNIENDFFMSMQERAEYAEDEVKQKENELAEVRADRSEKEIELNYAKDTITELRDKVREQVDYIKSLSEKIADCKTEINNLIVENNKQQAEITKLKAECYDYMRRETA